MVEPKTIGTIRTSFHKSPAERRMDLQVMVPLKNEVRKVEAFDATGVANSVSEIITAENSTFNFLRMARLHISDGVVIQRHLANEEAIYFSNRGKADIDVDGRSYTIEKDDALYVGIGKDVKLCSNHCDVSEFRAIECHSSYPVQLIRRSDIIGTPLAADLGNRRPMSQRTVYKLVDQNVQACRLLFGVTYMANSGGVGSYPPHFHGPDGPHGLGDNAKEEIYHFRCESDIQGDVPYVLQNCAFPEEKVNVYAHIFDDMAINVTSTYHDTIAPPSVDFMFTWCLGSYTEGHRVWSEIYNKPGFENEW